MKIVGKKILVKQRLTEQVSKGGIVMAGDQQPLPIGEVVTLGEEVTEGAVVVGDLLLFTEIGAIPLGIKKNHVLIEFEDVLAVLDEEDMKHVGP
jgi:co-chaperonin GroES (HSP10)